MKDRVVFFGEFFREFKTTGSFFPTSKEAASVLSAPIREISSGKKILELGPGTGSVTVKILEDMSPSDELTICEINPRLMKVLKERLAKNENFLRHRSRIRFFECAAQELPEDQNYNVIVCALPFLNFPVEVTREIFAKIKKLSSAETIMTFYEYVGFKALRNVLSAKDRRTLRDLSTIYHEAAGVTDLGFTTVWRNVFPIRVYRMKLAGFHTASSVSRTTRESSVPHRPLRRVANA